MTQHYPIGLVLLKAKEACLSLLMIIQGTYGPNYNIKYLILQYFLELKH
jgi:hypothetical protein